MAKYTINNILGAGFGESSGQIRAKFRKVIMVKDYQPEEYEFEATLEVGPDVKGADRALMSVILEAQNELAAHTHLLCLKLITQDEYNKRKDAVELSVSALAAKYEQVTGKSADVYLGSNEE